MCFSITSALTFKTFCTRLNPTSVFWDEFRKKKNPNCVIEKALN